MFKYSSRKINIIIFRLFFVIFCLSNSKVYAQFIRSSEAVVQGILSEQYILAYSDSNQWSLGETLPIISQNSKIGVIAYVEVQNLKSQNNSSFELKLKLIRQSKKFMIQKGDLIRKLDLSSNNRDFLGSTELLVKKADYKVSSKYRPLVYQGISIGETAQTLYKKEFLVTYFGDVHYGATPWLSVGTFATANFLNRPNANFKAKFYDSDSTTLALGMSYVRLNDEKQQSTVNLNFFWDSLSSDSLISHTFLSLSLVSWDSAADNAAYKALGSSSFQTGYELIGTDWNRFLIGPSYNFEKKALGGYLSYIWILDRVHFQASINSTDITQFKLNQKDGYYGFFDVYWRF